MSSGLRVVPVASRTDLKRFIAFPYDLYREEKYWVPPLRIDQSQTLNPKKNAFFEHGEIQPFLAVDSSGSVVGRIAAIINGMHLEKYDDGVGFFGFFESIEDFEVASLLFETAEGWLRDQGLNAVRGPTNPSMNDVSGLLVNGFDRYPAVLMPYNFEFYQDFLVRCGFERVMTMYAYYIHLKYRELERLQRGVSVIKKRYPGIRVRTIDMDRFQEEAELILDIYNDAWSENWGHVPMTDNEFQQLADDMKMILDPRIIYVLEIDGEPVGFSIMLPDVHYWFRDLRDGRLFPFGIFHLLKHKFLIPLTECRVALMGIRKAYQGRGFDAVLNLESLQAPTELGYVASEMSWVLASNQKMISGMEILGGVQDKEYAMFEKTL